MIVRARHADTRREVAVKSFSKGKCARASHLAEAMRTEIGVMQLLRESRQHEGVASMLELCESLSSVHICLEYCAGGARTTT